MLGIFHTTEHHDKETESARETGPPPPGRRGPCSVGGVACVCVRCVRVRVKRKRRNSECSRKESLRLNLKWQFDGSVCDRVCLQSLCTIGATENKTTVGRRMSDPIYDHAVFGPRLVHTTAHWSLQGAPASPAHRWRLCTASRAVASSARPRRRSSLRAVRGGEGCGGEGCGGSGGVRYGLSLIHISEPTRPY